MTLITSGKKSRLGWLLSLLSLCGFKHMFGPHRSMIITRNEDGVVDGSRNRSWELAALSRRQDLPNVLRHPKRNGIWVRRGHAVHIHFLAQHMVNINRTEKCHRLRVFGRKRRNEKKQTKKNKQKQSKNEKTKGGQTCGRSCIPRALANTLRVSKLLICKARAT